ncbi:enoyl-CoA hydratase/isomerase family protein [Salinisphaera sp. SPP-AMP-43]|uniref:enoyl-CoA hydratase/isomerase family protein n=1 Tax=Salinisphaera sp. SPP-AMP-43 TaxID=3121288 RepID=UPI003C6E9466
MPAETVFPLHVARDGTTTQVVLARPDKRNALSADLVEALIDIVATAEGDGTRLLSLRGDGKNFSAGFDFSGFEDESEGDLLRRFVRIEQLLQALAHAPFDTVAHAHGRNFGAGVDLFAVCNRRWATPQASFRMPGLGFGLVLGSRRFADLVGADWAREVLHDGVTFDAATARERGFVTDLVAAEDVGPRIDALAASGLSADAAARLFRVIRRDTRDADMAELVASAAEPGLKARMRAYREAAAAQAQQQKAS